jgi:hypothetical protein
LQPRDAPNLKAEATLVTKHEDDEYQVPDADQEISGDFDHENPDQEGVRLLHMMME